MRSNNEPRDPNDYERVRSGNQCPHCGEDDIDHLVWLDDETVRCDSCGTVYDPNQPDKDKKPDAEA